jgi:hypothetical protein
VWSWKNHTTERPTFAQAQPQAKTRNVQKVKDSFTGPTTVGAPTTHLQYLR